MEQLHLQANLDSFFARLAAAPRRVLLLDYDGTLAPLQAERQQAAPYAGVPEVLAAIRDASRTRVVVVSGRSVADLAPLLGLDPLPELWGAHGCERRLPDGAYQRSPLGEQAREGLEAAYAALAAHGLGHMLEQKPASLALHWRGLDEAAVVALRETIGHLWTAIVLRSRLRVHLFDGGLELRVAGCDKGAAVRALLDELGPGAAIAYLGDDLTDEDAFHALGGRGLRVLVRPEQRPSAADLWLRPPSELLHFLHTWARVDAAHLSAPAKEAFSYDRHGID